MGVKSKCSLKRTLMGISCGPGDRRSNGECLGDGNIFDSLKPSFFRTRDPT